jgi:hypothetical protein
MFSRSTAFGGEKLGTGKPIGARAIRDSSAA